MIQSAWYDVYVEDKGGDTSVVSSHHLLARDRAEAASQALRKRFGFRTRLLRDGRVVRTGRHGRIRRTLAEDVSVKVNAVEED